MKILQFDREKGHAKLKIQTELDLWYLRRLLKEGDEVRAKTLRTIFIERERRREKIGKKLVTLSIKVEDVKFHPIARSLRVKGRITEAPKDVPKGSYHTIEVKPSTSLQIKKPTWEEKDLKELERAVKFLKYSEPQILAEFFAHLGKTNGLALYGLKQVKSASEVGAVKVLLISKEKLWEEEAERLIDLVEKKRGEIRIVSRESKEGKTFCKTHGVGAILRFVVA